MVGCDIFVVNDEAKVLLICRTDNGFWSLPGGCQDLGETPAQCARRECLEESGFEVEVVQLMGVFSSRNYVYVNYPYKENEFTHILFQGVITGGEARTSLESSAIGWFQESELPPLSDGHEVRIKLGFKKIHRPELAPFFE